MRGAGGLSEILRSDEDLAEMCRDGVRGSGVELLDILPCGTKPSDPGELLSGPRFEDLVAWTEANYDQILIDCPPILAASDAAIVGRSVDGVMLVVQPGVNHRQPRWS